MPATHPNCDARPTNYHFFSLSGKNFTSLRCTYCSVSRTTSQYFRLGCKCSACTHVVVISLPCLLGYLYSMQLSSGMGTMLRAHPAYDARGLIIACFFEEKILMRAWHLVFQGQRANVFVWVVNARHAPMSWPSFSTVSLLRAVVQQHVHNAWHAPNLLRQSD